MKDLINYFSITCIMLFGILSCTPDNPPPNPPTNNTVSASWQATINGVSYNYSDTYIGEGPTNTQGNNEGRSDICVGHIVLQKGGPYTPGDDVKIEISHNETYYNGSYNILPSSLSSLNIIIIVNGVVVGHSGSVGSNITLNITEVPATSGGLIKGNFNGVIGVGGQTGIPISGQFQALRIC
jgi:hypothetical protein